MSETWGVVKAQSTQKENGRRDERTAKAFPANYILPSSWNTSRGKILLHIFDSFSPSNKLSNVNFCLANLFGIFLPSHASIILSRFDFAFLSSSQIQGWTLSKIRRGGFLCQTKSEVFRLKIFQFSNDSRSNFYRKHYSPAQSEVQLCVHPTRILARISKGSTHKKIHSLACDCSDASV